MHYRLFFNVDVWLFDMGMPKWQPWESLFFEVSWIRIFTATVAIVLANWNGSGVKYLTEKQQSHIMRNKSR